MHIVHIIPQIDSSGGAERLVVQLASKMAEKHTVTVITYRDIPKGSSYVKEFSSKVSCISLGKKKGFNFTLTFRLFKLLRHLHPDIVNAHLPSSFLYLILSTLFIRKIKYVLTVHSLPTHEESRKWVVRLRTVLIKLRRLFMVVLSDKSAKEFSQYYGINNRVEIINNGIVAPKTTNKLSQVYREIEDLKFTDSTKVFVNIGRIDMIKNQTMLSEVFHQLRSEGYDVLLLVIGEPTTYISNNAKYKHLLKYDNVRFLGLKENIGDYLSLADAFCLSSYKEGLPLVVLEALSFGLPIISTPVGGVPDVIKKENGFISSDFTPKAFYKQMREFLDLDNEQVKSIKIVNTNLFSQYYTIDSVAKNYIRFYNTLLKENA